jgi:hypothetical protein
MHLFLALRKGRLAIGFYEAFHSQIEFLLLPLFSHALFFYHHVSERIGLGSVEVVSSAVFFFFSLGVFITGSTWNEIGKDMGKEAHLIVRCYCSSCTQIQSNTFKAVGLADITAFCFAFSPSIFLSL